MGSLSETKEESGAAKKSESGAVEKSENESNSSSSQQNSAIPSVPTVPSVVPSVQESSTEELLKILEEGNLSEAGVLALRAALDGLKKKAGEVAERIKQLEEVLSEKTDLEEADKEAAVVMVNLAGCIKSVTVTVA